MDEKTKEKILHEHVRKIVKQFEEVDAQVFILIYDTKDKFNSISMYGCQACLFDALVQHIEKIKNEPHTGNKSGGRVH